MQPEYSGSVRTTVRRWSKFGAVPQEQMAVTGSRKQPREPPALATPELLVDMGEYGLPCVSWTVLSLPGENTGAVSDLLCIHYHHLDGVDLTYKGPNYTRCHRQLLCPRT